MITNLQPELYDFVMKFLKEHKIKNVDLCNLGSNTSLDLDLNLFDLDIDLFFADFIKTFEIDYTNFDWKSYGYPKGSYAFILVRSFLNYKLSWVKWLAHLIYKPKITLGTFQRAIDNGVLV